MLINFDPSKASAVCANTNGIGPSVLKKCISEYLEPFAQKKFKIHLASGKEMLFLKFQENNKTVIVSAHSLSSNCGEDGVAIENLPEILSLLADKMIKFDLLQFPQAFMVTGFFSGTTYRAHFNHIILYKDGAQVNASIIDSTLNPIGVSNPLLFFMPRSLVSGAPLLQTQLENLLSLPGVMTALQSMCGLAQGDKVRMDSPIYTYQQPITGDRRCGIYVLSAIADLTTHFINNQHVPAQDINSVVSAAHQKLNDLDADALELSL